MPKAQIPVGEINQRHRYANFQAKEQTTCSDGEASRLGRDETERYPSWRARILIAETGRRWRHDAWGRQVIDRSRSAINGNVSVQKRVCDVTVPCLNLCITFEQGQLEARVFGLDC